MPTFGQYETGQRLHLSGVGAIYVIKSDEKKIVRVLRPPPGIWTPEQLHEEISGFLGRAKTQKGVARSSENWAPIYDAVTIHDSPEGGSEEGGGESTKALVDESQADGAYLVMNRYERTVKALIDGRVNLNNNDLRTVMTGIFKGLRDIRVAAGRPHGNLKPANILLNNSTDLAQATVHLSDPSPDSAITPATDKKDFSDLAKLLYELVNLKPYQGGTIPKTKDWTELGPNGEDWRKLCNTLLDIGGGGGTPEERDLDKIIATVDTWRAKPRRSKLPMVAVGVLMVLILGGVAVYMLTRPPKLNFDEANWQKLCLAYNSWFDNVASMDEATKKKYSAAPYPTEVVKLLNGAGRELDKYQPQNIAKKAQSYVNLGETPTDDAKTGYGPYYTKQGDALIDKVAAALTPAHWELLTTLDKTAATYEKRGWIKPAEGIRGIIEAAKPPVIPTAPADVEARAKLVPKVDMFANIDNTIKASNSVIDIEKRWAAIQEEIKKLPVTQVPLLQAFPKFAEDLPRTAPAANDTGTQGTLADVQALAVSFNKIQQAATQLAADLNRKDQPIVFSELAKDPGAQVPADGKITLAMYEALPALARGYVKLPQDPRTQVAWTQSVDDIQKSLIDPIKDANPQDAHLAGLREQKAALEKEVADFGAIAPIEKNRQRLDSLVLAAKGDLEKLKADGEMYVAPYIIDPAKYIAQQRARLTNGPLSHAAPAVYDAWKKADSALLEKVAAAPNELKKYRTFQSIDGKFAALQNIYADFDAKMIPSAVPGLSDFPAGTPWKTAIAARVATVYREQALHDLMTNPALKWADDLPLVKDPAYESYAKDRIAAYERTRAEALSLIDDYATIQSRLDHLDLLPDEPVKGAKTWRELFLKWKQSGNPLLADPDILVAVKPIADRAAALLALDGVTDYQALVGDELAAVPEISLTAWRKMGQVPLSENLPVLEDEQKAEAHLSGELAAGAKTGRLTTQRTGAITVEMNQQRPLRWRRYVAVLTTSNLLQQALDQRIAFGVTLSPQTDSNLAFDDALYQLRREFAQNPKDAQLKAVAKQFIASVQAMPAGVSGDRSIQDLLARMAKPLAPGAQDISTAGAGPKLAGWEQESPSPDVRIFYYPHKAGARQMLEFTRIQAGDKTVFLCTTEMSFGLFAALANSHIADLENTGKPAAKAHWFQAQQDTWDGPKVWKIIEGEFVANPDWLFKSPQLGNNSQYAPNAEPPKPGAAFPMQQLSPWSAMYVARLLGCRLPTSAEWEAAYQKFEAHSNGPKDAWNLRGNGWIQQQNYALKMSTKGVPFPDQGIFLQADQLFAGITADAALPWKPADLAAIAPARITPGPVYGGSQIWFRKVGSEPGVPAPGTGAGIPHDLVGNVAEYVFDGPGANTVIKDTAVSVESVDNAITAGSKSLFVIGGSALSPPQTPFNKPQAVDPDFAQTSTGFSDVGFRLAYTAPIDSIADVLAAVFRAPPYLSPAGGKVIH